ncbi:hypothetical protein NEUTE1DRAFT_99125 [Neurospora tetrasperma FGSC 2508]|uniref:Uncharacterized protein n=1 Tax=Neurospora tetrasperma (strain FGSC 2508 / ATCC MYA-4615 / P0657) TaxID=510951 RepID=F8MI78_NEUT8|nr:uncharacterized protein NEUTE1DRAFT_99125 [Neurospora tetrasperma FGSC 2508]EGO58934.1 hypothetical protein NEUTE1DRAFT_99125 [Neurospora tetrasperma FGSC 2508]
MAGRRGWGWRACGWSVCPSATFDVLDVQGGSRTATGQRLGSGRSGLAGGFCNLRQPNFRQVARRSFSGTFASENTPPGLPTASVTMGQYYNLFGQKLAMGVLGSLFGGVYLASGGSSKTPATPPINASSSDEADFIKKFLETSETTEKQAPAAAPAKH